MKTKNAILIILISAFGAFNTYSQLPSYVPSNGLLGYWPFNGNANDESGKGYNGIVNSATLTNDRNGKANQAYSFNGVNNYIKVNDNLDFKFSSHTISFWYSRDALPLSQSGTCSNTGNEMLISKGRDISSNSISVTHSNVGGTFQNYVISNSSINNSILLSKWTSVVLTYDAVSKTQSMFQDGILISTKNNITFNANLNTGPLGFGAHSEFINSNLCSFFYKGKLDDIAIWNRALTQEEITSLYNSCSNPTATITALGNTTFCQDGSVSLSASTGSNYTYQWYNNSQIINGEIASTYQASSSGNYTVKVSDGACNTTSTETTVTVNPNPIVSLNSLTPFILTTSSPIQLVGNPSGGSFSGDAVVGSTFTPSNATLGKKTISYSYTNLQGCSGSATQNTIIADTVGNVCGTYDTLKIQVKFTAGLYANTVNYIKFYPNPTNDILHIDNSNYLSMSGYSIKIISLTGSVIYNQPIVSQQVQISMNQFATKGLYIAQILDSNNAIVDSKKIVLE